MTRKYMIFQVEMPQLVDSAASAGYDIRVHLEDYSGTVIHKIRSGEEDTDWEFLRSLANEAYDRILEKRRLGIPVSVEEVEDGCES